MKYQTLNLVTAFDSRYASIAVSEKTLGMQIALCFGNSISENAI